MNIKQRISKYASVLVMAIVMLIGILIVLSLKKDYHVDETMSYLLANNRKTWMSYEVGKIYQPANEAFKYKYAAVDGYTFDLKIPWENQKADVHPPLYYVLLHFICSFTPNRFGMWQGAIINIVFGFAMLIVMRKIIYLWASEEELNNKIFIYSTDFALLAFVISPYMMNNMSFLRMYIMASFWILLISYSVLVLVKNILENRSNGWTIWIAIAVEMVMAALTHYYCIMYIIFLQMCLFVFLIVKKKYKYIVIQIISSVVAALVSLAAFPTMLDHVFNGYRGEQVINNLTHVGMNRYISQLWGFFEIIDRGIFGGFLLVGIIFLIGYYICQYVYLGCKRKKGNNDNRLIMIGLLLVPSICYWILLSKITISLDPRYISIAGATIFLAVFEIVLLYFKNINWHFGIGVSLVVGIIVTSAYSNANWNTLYRDEEAVDNIKQHTDLDVVVVGAAPWKAGTVYEGIKNSASICFINPDAIEQMVDNGLSEKSEIIVYVSDGKYIDDIIDIMPGVDSFEYWGKRQGYFEIYYLYGNT